MALDEEVKLARHDISTDGYDMSLGELISLYSDGELIINPAFQRLFRWSTTQKTRFIESLLLGIPIPPIFVYQTEEGIWELIDGLQRLSTVFEFVGILKDADGNIRTPSVMAGTSLLPSLANKVWETANQGSQYESIGRLQQLEIKRARMRVEILKRESDPLAKYELFQRLNTGGSRLSEQEVRNAILVMINHEFYQWLSNLAETNDFLTTTALTDRALSRQYHIELALRFFVYRLYPYEGGLDVHEYLDESMIRIATDNTFDLARQGETFNRTFQVLSSSMGADTFKRWDGERFVGSFLLSAYDVIALGIATNLHHLEELNRDERDLFIRQRIISIWQDDAFQRHSGAGVRGTTRLANLLPIAGHYFEK